jgi:hypothetical protein
MKPLLLWWYSCERYGGWGPLFFQVFLHVELCIRTRLGMPYWGRSHL